MKISGCGGATSNFSPRFVNVSAAHDKSVICRICCLHMMLLFNRLIILHDDIDENNVLDIIHDDDDDDNIALLKTNIDDDVAVLLMHRISIYLIFILFI